MVFEYIQRTTTPPFQVYKLHQEVMATACGNGHGLNNEELRPLWRSINQGDKGSILLVRSSYPPLGSSSKVTQQSILFETGQIRRFNCRLNLSTRAREEHPLKTKGFKKVEKSICASELSDWLKQLLLMNGMELMNASIVSQRRVTVKHRHFINAADILFNARIIDPLLATNAYERGIGRKKAFGFGLLIEADAMS